MSLPIEEYRRAFNKECKQIGIEGLVPHGLPLTRVAGHRWPSRRVANVKVVQRMLGPRGSGDDLGSFTGLFDDDLAGGADALGKAIETAAVSLRYDSEEKSDGEMAN